MGSGDWIKSIVHLKKVKNCCSKRASAAYISKSSSSSRKSHSEKESTASANGAADGTPNSFVTLSEHRAAIRIQTAFRDYAARKALRRLKDVIRLQKLTQNFPMKKQAATMLGYLHSWSKIQSQVRACRLRMVT